MSNYIKPTPWDGKQIRPIDESIYTNRRDILKKLGLITGGILAGPYSLSACTFGDSKSKDQGTSSIQEGQGNHFTFPGMDKFYPAERNKKYTLDRPITAEYEATHYNNFYEFISRSDPNIYNVYKFVDDFDNRDWKFEVTGAVKKKGTYQLEDIIKRFGLQERTYRFRCVERWSMAVPWTGFPLADLVKFLEPENTAKYIRMTTFADPKPMPGVRNLEWYPWPYHEGLRMDEAMNELAFIATGIYGKPLPKQNGAPMRLVVPWKYGYKNIKSIVKMEFVDKEPETFWHKIAPDEYPFISNVNPEKPHPRWSQAIERMIPDGEPRPTLKYNGYGEFVAKLYE
ncbi:MAG: protein-methionine-sulfoxide reductase catalytic subunit MsrP [Bacteroidota bacterium]